MPNVVEDAGQSAAGAYGPSLSSGQAGMGGRRTSNRKKVLIFTLFIVLFGILAATSSIDYLLFHSLAEALGVVASFTIASIVLISRRHIENNYLRILGVSYIFTAIIELLHMLSFKGMGIFPNDANLPTQLWLAFRYVQAFTLLVAPLAIGRRITWPTILIIFTALTSALLSTIFLGIFPAAYIESVGLTQFKIHSEHAIIILAAIGGWLLYRERSRFDRAILRLLMAAIVMFIIAELMFTLYFSVYSEYNLLGHLFMLADFLLVFMAIVHTGMVKPTRLLYRELAGREALFRGLVEGSKDLIFQYQFLPEPKVIYISPSVEEITGFPQEDFYNDSREPFRFMKSSHGNEIMAMIHSGKNQDLRTMKIYRMDGKAIWLQVSVSVEHDGKGGIVRVDGIARDVTETLTSFHKLHLAQNKLKLLGNLTNHDLHNQITAAMGYLQLVEDSTDEGRKADFLAKGYAALERMDQIVGVTRKYYELGQVPPVWMSLREVIEQELSSSALIDLDITVDVPDMEIYADEMFGQALFNLAHNTLVHGEGMTRAIISGRITDDRDLLIIYEDRGPGIPEGEKELIFDWDHRLRRGHGLHFVSEVLAITRMGIRETGTPGEGVRFEILVPRYSFRAVTVADGPAKCGGAGTIA